jgi:cytochrome c6
MEIQMQSHLARGITRIAVVVALALTAGLQAVPVMAAEDPLVLGKQLFTKTAVPPCMLCHTLKEAGASGAVGPNLDELKPNAARITKALRDGLGQMPPYKSLNEEQILALARYVSQATGGGN